MLRKIVSLSTWRSAHPVRCLSSGGGPAQQQPHSSAENRKALVTMLEKYDHANYLCTLLLPAELRSAATAIRCFNIEVAQISDSSKEGPIRAMRYLFWKDAIELMYTGGNPTRHPVALCLADAVKRHSLPRHIIATLLEARENDPSNSNTTFASSKGLEQYGEDTTAAVLHLIMAAAGTKNDAAFRAASHVGRAMAIANVLKATPFLCRTGELRLPRQLLDKYGVTQGELQQGEATDPIRDIAHELASSAFIHIETAKSIEGLATVENQVLLPAIPTTRYLDALQATNFDLFDPALVERDQLLPLVLAKHRYFKGGSPF